LPFAGSGVRVLKLEQIASKQFREPLITARYYFLAADGGSPEYWQRGELCGAPGSQRGPLP
jgi:hypothetical protein